MLNYSMLARNSSIALGLALVPVVAGALIRTAKQLPWQGFDWSSLALIVLAAAVAMAGALALAHQYPGARVIRIAKNLCFSACMFLGLMLALSAYRTLTSLVAAVDYKTIAIVVVVGGGLMGIAMSLLEKGKGADPGTP